MKTMLVLTLVLGLVAASGETPVLQLENPEMAGISGFRAYWDRPVVLADDGATRRSDHGQHGAGPVADWSTDKPGAPVFDAVHRSLLVRFPDSAEKIAEQVGKGFGPEGRTALPVR